MRAAVLREGRLEVRETPDPIPGAGQILVRSLACGICASDLHFMDNPEGVTEDDSGLWDYDAARDIVMGHEYCAEIVAYGPETEQRWPRGTRVTSQPVLAGPGPVRLIGCSPDAPGGFAQLMLMSESITQEVTGDAPNEQVALADALSVGYYYVRRAALTPTDVPLVIGGGAIGLTVVAALRRRGISPIVVADYVASRREVASAMGADVLVDPAVRDAFEVWREVAFADRDSAQALFGDSDPDTPTCVVFECVGVPGVLDAIIRGAERDTRIFSAGGPPQGDFIHPMVAKRKGLSILFGGGPRPEDFTAALEDICSGATDVSPLIGAIVPLADTPAAIDAARRADGPPRFVVLPNS